MTKNRITGKTSPRVLFDFLKFQTNYKDDPKNIELVHSVGSLFENNYHNSRGAGDCDDFTVLSMACLYCMGFKTGYILFSNGANPTHIAAYYIDDSGNGIPFDLTAGSIGELRKYKKTEFSKIIL